MLREYKPDKEGIFIPDLQIVEHPQKGYVCIAANNIENGSLIERCLTIQFSRDTIDQLWEYVGGRTVFHDYNFCQNSKGFSYFAMGYGGIYSHSENPSARWNLKYLKNERAVIEIRAIRDIKKGEEITILYSRNKNNLDFDIVE